MLFERNQISFLLYFDKICVLLALIWQHLNFSGFFFPFSYWAKFAYFLSSLFKIRAFLWSSLACVYYILHDLSAVRFFGVNGKSVASAMIIYHDVATSPFFSTNLAMFLLPIQNCQFYKTEIIPRFPCSHNISFTYENGS